MVGTGGNTGGDAAAPASARWGAGDEEAKLGEYLAERLHAHGVRHVFGRPGPFVDKVHERLAEAGLTVVTTGGAEAAGFAADAYARMRGLGAASASYGADGLRLVNAAAQAYAERSPLVILGGAPGAAERERHPLLDPGLIAGDERGAQRRAFAAVTVASAVLDDPDIACREVERVLAAALAHKRPVYLELPRDMVDTAAPVLPPPRPALAASHPPALAAALADAAAMLAAAERPAMVLGVEVQRFGLQDHVLRLMATTGIPTAVTLLGKSVIGEANPAFLGVYAGEASRPAVRDTVEGSDALLLIGAEPADLSPGGAVPRLDPAHCVDATGDHLAIGHHRYDRVRLVDFVAGLAAAPLPRRDLPPRAVSAAPRAVPSTQDAALDAAGLFARLAAFLSDETVVVADPGEALLPAAELPIGLCSEFMSPASYGARGFAIPASLGVQLAEPELRPLALVEPPAFVASVMELATAARHGLSPVVVVLNPSTGSQPPWDLARLPEVLGAGRGFAVTTAAELDHALAVVARHPDDVCVLDVRLGDQR